MDGRFEILDAFVDGERVDPVALKRALSDAEGRDYLVDAWVLRENVQDEMATDPAVPPIRLVQPARRSWMLAAAVAVVALIAGYTVGLKYGAPRRNPPPVVAPTPVNISPSAPRSFPAPAPTRVIRLELADWKEASGGN
jgi:hypothetical protein